MTASQSKKKISARYLCDVLVNSVRQGFLPPQGEKLEGSRGVNLRKTNAPPVRVRKDNFIDVNRSHGWLYETKILITSDPRIYLNMDLEIINRDLWCATTDIDEIINNIYGVYMKKNESFFRRHKINREDFMVPLVKQLQQIKTLDPTCCFWFPKDNFFLDILTFVLSELLVLEDFIPLTTVKDLNAFSFDAQFLLLKNSFRTLTRDNFVSCVKYHTAYLMAKALENEPPKRPDAFMGSPLIWSGPIKYFLKNILNRKGKQAFQLGFSFLQGIKRGCQMVPESYLEKAIVDHARQMMVPPTKSMEEIKEYFGNSINRLPKKKVKYFEFVDVFEPSHSSCFEKNKESGGQYGEIIESFNLEKTPIFVIQKNKVCQNLVYKTPENFHQLIMEKYKEWKGSYNRVLSTAVIPLSEPLKVRTITKAEAIPSYLSKSLQKSMKTYINKLPSMVLTTRPLIIQDFKDVFQRQESLETEYDFHFDQHVSGDYKSATDKLNINFTKLIFNKIMQILHVEEEMQPIFQSVLFEQELCYPARYTSILKKEFGEDYINTVTDLFTVMQQNGQLMGSILSFPILCLANLICYKTALEKYLTRISGKEVVLSYFDLPVLVNGDDIYFMANNEFYNDWKDSITMAGFELSIGKNYIHKKVFTINSQCFLIRNDGDIEEIGYLNLGLLLNQSKSGDQNTEKAIWSNYNQLTRQCFSPEITHRNFLYYNKPLVRKITRDGNYNLFLPPLLGGLGFIKPHGIECKLTHFQLEFATFLDNYDKTYQLPRFVTKESTLFHEPYMGDYVLKKVPAYQVHSQLERVKLDSSDMTFTMDIVNTKVLEFRLFNNDLLREFRKSKKNYTGKVYFNLENAYQGIYPYKWLYQFVPRSDESIVCNKIRIFSKLLGISLEEMFMGFKELVNPNIAKSATRLMLIRKFRNIIKRSSDHEILDRLLSPEEKVALAESLVSIKGTK